MVLATATRQGGVTIIGTVNPYTTGVKMESNGQLRYDQEVEQKLNLGQIVATPQAHTPKVKGPRQIFSGG